MCQTRILYSSFVGAASSAIVKKLYSSCFSTACPAILLDSSFVGAASSAIVKINCIAVVFRQPALPLFI